MSSSHNCAAIVVTYNRQELLSRCLRALETQKLPISKVFVIDNASTDNTYNWLTSYLTDKPYIEHVRLVDNIGGAGGFSFGIERAVADGYEWMWLMDDDAEPRHDALEQLFQEVISETDIYGSLAVNGEKASWPITLMDYDNKVVYTAEEIPNKARVLTLPFLGFLIHQSLVKHIGIPDSSFFIAADDIEYCWRARNYGAQIYIIGKSQITHPEAHFNTIRLPGRNLICLSLPPWKRYYDTRNRLLIAKTYFGNRWITQTIPGTIIRAVVALIYDDRKFAQIWAFTAGFIDGVIGKKGARHRFWRIGI